MLEKTKSPRLTTKPKPKQINTRRVNSLRKDRYSEFTTSSENRGKAILPSEVLKKPITPIGILDPYSKAATEPVPNRPAMVLSISSALVTSIFPPKSKNPPLIKLLIFEV